MASKKNKAKNNYKKGRRGRKSEEIKKERRAAVDYDDGTGSSQSSTH
jgi:hypothetical protein